MKDLQSKQQVIKRQLITKEKEITDLEIEKRGKERQLKNTSTANQTDKDLEMLERQLQRDLQDKDEELDRLKMMIRDKRTELEAKAVYHHHSGSGVDQSEEYQKISKDIDTVKLMIIDLKAQGLGVALP